MNAHRFVAALIYGNAQLPARQLLEATVRLPPRGYRWIAVYTGVQPGKQVWRSTGLMDRDAALVRAKEWEAQAKRKRAVLGLKPRGPNVRVPPKSASASSMVATGVEALSQREAAMILGISERALRAIERRAVEKLRNHPKLRQLWAEYNLGERLDDTHLEQPTELAPLEIAALLRLVRTDREKHALDKLLAWLH